jgi:hypothetical protein
VTGAGVLVVADQRRLDRTFLGISKVLFPRKLFGVRGGHVGPPERAIAIPRGPLQA